MGQHGQDRTWVQVLSLGRLAAYAAGCAAPDGAAALRPRVPLGAAHTAVLRALPAVGALWDEGAATPGAEGQQGVLLVGEDAVRAVRQELEVARVVVGPVAVQVVDMFAGHQRAREQELHHQAVHVERFAADPDLDVATVIGPQVLNPFEEAADLLVPAVQTCRCARR